MSPGWGRRRMLLHHLLIWRSLLLVRVGWPAIGGHWGLLHQRALLLGCRGWRRTLLLLRGWGWGSTYLLLRCWGWGCTWLLLRGSWWVLWRTSSCRWQGDRYATHAVEHGRAENDTGGSRKIRTLTFLPILRELNQANGDSKLGLVQ